MATKSHGLSHTAAHTQGWAPSFNPAVRLSPCLCLCFSLSLWLSVYLAVHLSCCSHMIGPWTHRPRLLLVASGESLILLVAASGALCNIWSGGRRMRFPYAGST